MDYQVIFLLIHRSIYLFVHGSTHQFIHLVVFRSFIFGVRTKEHLPDVRTKEHLSGVRTSSPLPRTPRSVQTHLDNVLWCERAVPFPSNKG